MLFNNYEVRVLVKGRPINEYSHNGQIFIEGRDGSNFEIEFKNQSPNRIEAVLSVDGLSVIDGKEAGPTSSGYVLGPYETVRIPGWKLTDEQVAAFQFAGKKGSYAAQSTGSARNTGVLGAMVFAEKRPAYVPVHHQYASSPMFGSAGGVVFHDSSSVTFGMAAPAVMRGMSSGGALSLNNVHATLTNAVPSGWAADDVVATASASIGSTMRSKSVSPGVSAQEVDQSHVAPVQQTLGTAFGEAQDFGTTEVTFNRGDLSALLVMYYDDSRGLRARGIELTRPSKRRLAPANAPQAFPGLQKGCVPPAGWKG